LSLPGGWPSSFLGLPLDVLMQKDGNLSIPWRAAERAGGKEGVKSTSWVALSSGCCSGASSLNLAGATLRRLPADEAMTYVLLLLMPLASLLALLFAVERFAGVLPNPPTFELSLSRKFRQKCADTNSNGPLQPRQLYPPATITSPTLAGSLADSRRRGNTLCVLYCFVGAGVQKRPLAPCTTYWW